MITEQSFFFFFSYNILWSITGLWHFHNLSHHPFSISGLLCTQQGGLFNNGAARNTWQVGGFG